MLPAFIDNQNMAHTNLKLITQKVLNSFILYIQTFFKIQLIRMVAWNGRNVINYIPLATACSENPGLFLTRQIYSLMAQRDLLPHGSEGFAASWLRGICSLMAQMDLLPRGSEGFAASWLRGICFLMAQRDLLAYGSEGFAAS